MTRVVLLPDAFLLSECRTTNEAAELQVRRQREADLRVFGSDTFTDVPCEAPGLFPALRGQLLRRPVCSVYKII